MNQALLKTGVIILLVITVITLQFGETCSSQPLSNPLDSIAQKIIDLGNAIRNIVESVKNAAMSILQVLSGAFIAIGLLLWSSDLNPYRGKKLVLTGLTLLVIFSIFSL